MAFISQPMFLWFLLAVVFLIVELTAPGFVAIFFTMGCLAASISAWLFGVSLQWQLVIFVVVSIGALVLFRKIARKIFQGNQGGDNDDDYAHARVGKTVVITEPVAPHHPGKVKLGGSFWIAVSDYKMVEGDVGLVVGVDADNSLILQIKPIEN